MPRLKPLEFNDCIIDGPKFRQTLQEHEKEISDASKGIKAIHTSAKLVFEAMEKLSDAFSQFSKSLRNYSISDGTGLTGTEELGETDDDKVLRSALQSYADLIDSMENMRKDMLTGPTKELVLGQIEHLKDKWLTGTKIDTRQFHKETAAFCQKQERYLAMKNKSPDGILKDADTAMKNDHRNYIDSSMKHILRIQKAQEKKKYKFVDSIILLIKMISTFHHQAWENFIDNGRNIDKITGSSQRSRESYKAIYVETTELKTKMLETPPERVRPSLGDPSITREGYLFLFTKKTVVASWVKYFCAYYKDTKVLTATPFTQTNAPKVTEEVYHIKSCVRRASDTIERRFCFDIEVEERTTVFTLQAVSNEDMQLWLTAMGGTEPIYADTNVLKFDPARTVLNANGYLFIKTCLDEIERRGLHEVGLYRMGGAKPKMDKFLQMGLDEMNIVRMHMDSDEHDTKTLASCVKHYIRHLGEPLMTYNLHDRFIAAAKLKGAAKRTEEVGALVMQLPFDNYNMLCLVIQHLNRVASQCEANKMTSANLGVVFGPTLFRPAETSVAAIMDIRFATVVVEILIENVGQFFPGHPVPPGPYACTDIVQGMAHSPLFSQHSGPAVQKQQGALGDVEDSGRTSPGSKSRGSQLITGSAPRRPKEPPKLPPGVGEGEGGAGVQPILEDEAPPMGIVASQVRSFSEELKPPNDNPTTDASVTRAVSERYAPPRSRPPNPPNRMSRIEGGNTPPPLHHSVSDSGSDGVSRRRVVSSGVQLRTEPPRRPPTGPLKNQGKKVRTLYQCVGESERELSFTANQIITNVRPSSEAGWLIGELDGKEGMIPQNYVECLNT